MILQVTFKTPDAIDFALQGLPEIEALPDSEYGDYGKEDFKNEIKKKLAKWVKYGELITIEFDLDDMTARVVEARRL